MTGINYVTEPGNIVNYINNFFVDIGPIELAYWKRLLGLWIYRRTNTEVFVHVCSCLVHESDYCWWSPGDEVKKIYVGLGGATLIKTRVRDSMTLVISFSKWLRNKYRNLWLIINLSLSTACSAGQHRPAATNVYSSEKGESKWPPRLKGCYPRITKMHSCRVRSGSITPKSAQIQNGRHFHNFWHVSWEGVPLQSQDSTKPNL